MVFCSVAGTGADANIFMGVMEDVRLKSDSMVRSEMKPIRRAEIVIIVMSAPEFARIRFTTAVGRVLIQAPRYLQ